MRAGRLLLIAAVCCGPVACGGGDEVTIQGSGATFPAPLYKRWFLEYYKQHSNVRVNYTPIGSGAGVFAFMAVVLLTGRFSPLAGGVALALLMLPATPGILTGVLLAVARAAGETTPLLFTMTFSDYWLSTHLMQPTASLAVLIYTFSKSPFENQTEIAWAAALVLVLMVLALNLGGQFISRRATRTSHK